ncbi:kinase-like domain-containing protein [Mycena latifolia]|nr:kinase-like domain-containing protein [Mycena latifolia]
MPPSPASQSLPDLTGAFVDEGYLQLVELLGCGGYAKVYKALDTTSSSDDPVFYAVKCMRNGAPGSTDVAILKNEFRNHRDVSHQPGVVTFHHIFTDGADGEFVFMVLDLHDGDMLRSLAQRHLYVDRPALVKDAFFEVLDAVEQCHSEGVFHRDLKPQNLLCNSAGTGIRLADFGMATKEDESQVFRCGTLAFMSPECADSTPHTRVSYSPRQSDLWAVGVILFSLVTSKTPWRVAEPSDTAFGTFRADEDGFLAGYHLTPPTRALFRGCFAAEPAARPSIPQMREAVRSIECFSLAHMLPASPPPPPVSAHPSMLNLSALCHSSLFTPPLLSGLPAPAPSTLYSSASSAGPCTLPLSAHPPILDAANVGFAAVHPPPLVPTKLYAPTTAYATDATGSIVMILRAPLKKVPEYRFLDRKKQNISTRQRFADKLRRVN